MEESLPDEVEAELQMEASAKAATALAKAPAGPERDAKIAKVSEGIFKQLKKKYLAAKSGGASQVATASAGPATQTAKPPPPPPPAAAKSTHPVPKALEGVGMCGDELWFTDLVIRRRLQQRDVAAVHAKQKVLMGNPADEVSRICRGLGAGGVLRLGGKLGFYGEEDVAYCYRQTSRLVHPDKNSHIPDAGAAFKGLREAADELKQGLAATRDQLQKVTQLLGGFVGEEDLKRPQEALLAEMSKVLHDVLGLSGEGGVKESHIENAVTKFASSSSRCDAASFLTLFYDSPPLLDCLAGTTLRVAFDCAPKHLRAQFICALYRVSQEEIKRKGDTRSTWVAIEANFPEMEWWCQLRHVIGKRAAEAVPKVSKFDQTEFKAETEHKASEWAQSYQDKLNEIWVSQFWEAEGSDIVDCMNPRLRKLAVEIWRDIIAWAKPNVAPRCLELFAADGSETQTLVPDDPAFENPVMIGIDCSFVPASDLFLLIAPGLLGITSGGMSWAKSPTRELEVKDFDAFENMGDAKQKEQLEKQCAEGFDWEKAWRNKRDVQKMLRQDMGETSWGRRDRSRSNRRRNRSRDRDRDRRRGSSRDRRMRSRSRRR